MNTIAYDPPEPGLDPYEDDGAGDGRLPRRPHRSFFNRRSAALVAILTCAVGFYAGVRVEKGQIASTPVTLSGTGSAAAGARGSAAGAAGAAGARGSAAGATGTGGASRAAGAGGTTGALAGLGARLGGAGGANASVGTVSTVDGKSLVVTETSGNAVRVKLSSSTKVTKSQSVSHSAIRPGDSVVIEGVPNSSGTVVAATVSDTGAGRAGGFGGFGSASARSGSGASSSGGSGSAVRSLFSGGGGG